jgi:hypothetical protein
MDLTEPRFTFVDAGKEVISTEMPNLSGARLHDVEAAMHAFALTHATQPS